MESGGLVVNWYGFLWFSMVFYGFVATSSHEENPSALCQATFCRMATTEAPHGGWAVGGPSAISRGPAMDGRVPISEHIPSRVHEILLLLSP